MHLVVPRTCSQNCESLLRCGYIQLDRLVKDGLYRRVESSVILRKANDKGAGLAAFFLDVLCIIDNSLHPLLERVHHGRVAFFSGKDQFDIVQND